MEEETDFVLCVKLGNFAGIRIELENWESRMRGPGERADRQDAKLSHVKLLETFIRAN